MIDPVVEVDASAEAEFTAALSEATSELLVDVESASDWWNSLLTEAADFDAEAETDGHCALDSLTDFETESLKINEIEVDFERFGKRIPISSRALRLLAASIPDNWIEFERLTEALPSAMFKLIWLAIESTIDCDVDSEIDVEPETDPANEDLAEVSSEAFNELLADVLASSEASLADALAAADASTAEADLAAESIESEVLAETDASVEACNSAS